MTPVTVVAFVDDLMDRSRLQGIEGRRVGDVQIRNQAYPPDIEPRPQPVGELQRCQEQHAGTGHAMRQQPPLERFNVGPFRVLRVKQEALIVP